MKKFKPLEEIRKAIINCENQWQKDIDDTKNPFVKEFKQDLKSLAELERKLVLFGFKYGIEVELVFPDYDRFTKNLNIKYGDK